MQAINKLKDFQKREIKGIFKKGKLKDFQKRET